MTGDVAWLARGRLRVPLDQRPGRLAADAAGAGFGAKACIHPAQVPVVRAAYRPTEDEVSWADRVLAVAATQPGVFRFEGRMVDEPVIRQARAIRARALGIWAASAAAQPQFLRGGTSATRSLLVPSRLRATAEER